MPVKRAEIGPSLIAAVAFMLGVGQFFQALAAGDGGLQHLRVVQRLPHACRGAAMRRSPDISILPAVPRCARSDVTYTGMGMQPSPAAHRPLITFSR